MSLSRAFSLFAQTKVFLPWRILLAVTGAVTLVVAIKLGLMIERRMFEPDALGSLDGLPAAGIGLALWLFGNVLFRGAILSRIRVPHLATMVALLDGRESPLGQTQIGEGQVIVWVRLGRGRSVARLDRLLRAVVRGISTLVDEGTGADQVGQTPGLHDRALRLYRRLAAGPTSEAILGHALRNDDEDNGWDKAHDAAVLLAQNSARILGAAGRLVLAGWVLALVVFLTLLESFALLSGALGGAGPLVPLFLALVLAACVKVALIDPLIMGCLLQGFFATTEGQEPNAEWRGLLVHALPAFRKLAEGAEAWRPEPVGLAPSEA